MCTVVVVTAKMLFVIDITSIALLAIVLVTIIYIALQPTLFSVPPSFSHPPLTPLAQNTTPCL